MSEAVELFSTCSEHDRAANQAKIEIIVQELGYLALAVTLTGSYVGQDLAHGELCVEVPALSPQEAMELLRLKLKGSASSFDVSSTTERLLDVLGYIPLARRYTPYILQEGNGWRARILLTYYSSINVNS